MSNDEERKSLFDKDGHQENGRKNCKLIEVLCEFNGCLKKARNGFYLNEEGSGSSSPQELDFSYVPSLNDELALSILARVPRSEYKKLGFVNRRYQSLIRSGELYSTRKTMGIKEPSVLMLASGEPHWWSYDPRSRARCNLPTLPSDSCFSSFDKESLCAGTHLLVSGKEVEGSVVWRYELALDQWFRGPHMISLRCLFASANCGSVACVAGGVVSGIGMKPQVLDTAEIYDSEKKTWRLLPAMSNPRKLCSGCYMDNKFYVIGGQNEKGENLTSGEVYDLEKNSWELITDMMKEVPNGTYRSPPLIAVANNELYSLEASSNQLRMYIKKSKTWKDLGMAPVRADHSRGWGVAFKSLGDELLVIGSSSGPYTCRGVTICTCRPDPTSDTLDWKALPSIGEKWSSFIFNCSIMVV